MFIVNVRGFVVPLRSPAQRTNRHPVPFAAAVNVTLVPGAYAGPAGSAVTVPEPTADVNSM
jgi:hypothetical protein